MKISRKIQLWLADRHPAFDRPSLYRRTVVAERPALGAWDAALLAMVGVFVLLIGLGGLVVSIFLIGVIVSTWFG